MRHVVHATIWPGEGSGYVAECAELCAVTQGATLDEVVYNLREACALALEDGGAAHFNVVPEPTIVVTLAIEPLLATA